MSLISGKGKHALFRLRKRSDLASNSYFYPPTLIAGTESVKATELRIWREEAFGPVLVLISFETEEEAIALANDSEYGLGMFLRLYFVLPTWRVTNTHLWNDGR